MKLSPKFFGLYKIMDRVQKKSYFVEVYISICGGFYPLRINIEGFSKPP